MSLTDLIFEWIEMSGFMSFPPNLKQKLTLNTYQITAIMGENLDGGPGEKNGAGKSAIIDAILYLYFGKTPRLPNHGLLNYIEPGTLLVRGAASRNGLSFLVERGEKPAILRLFVKPSDDDRDWYTEEDGKYLFEQTKSSKPETTKYISELIGFDFKLSDVLIFNTSSEKSCFFEKNEEDQRVIVERIFGFTVFTEKANRLREIRKEENKNLATKESALIATRQANDRILREITLLEEKANEWGVQRDNTVKFLRQQIHTYKNIDFEHEVTVLEEVDKINQNIDILEKTIKPHKTSLSHNQNLQTSWKSQHETTLAVLKGNIEKLRKADAAADIQTLRLKNKLEEEIKQIRTEISAKQQEISSLHQKLRQEIAQHDRVANSIRDIEEQVKQLKESKCPTCGQDWKNNKDHLTQCKNQIKTLNQEAAELKKEISETEKNINTAEEISNQYRGKESELKAQIENLPPTTFASPEEASAAHTRLEELTQQYERERSQTNPYTDLIETRTAELAKLEEEVKQLQADKASKPETFYKSLNEAVMGFNRLDQLKTQLDEALTAENPHRSTIVNLRENALKEVDETEIRQMKNRIEHLSLLITLLADRDSPIRKSVINEWLPELNSRVNHYLEVLELPQRIVFDPDMTATFKLDVDSKGTIREQELAFGNLSTGQRLRVWLSTNLAFREIFELINYRINLFFVDEVLDKGMSPRGAEVAYRMLERMVSEKKSIFLITHRTELSDIAENTISVVFENKLSILRNA